MPARPARRLPGIRGFTLIESVIILAVLGILLVIGSHSLLSVAPRYRLEISAGEVRTGLNAARFKAIFEMTSVRVQFSGEGFSTERYNSENGTWTLVSRKILEGVRIEANNAPIFTAMGTVSGLATITVSNAWGAYKITLAISGRIKMLRAS